MRKLFLVIISLFLFLPMVDAADMTKDSNQTVCRDLENSSPNTIIDLIKIIESDGTEQYLSCSLVGDSDTNTYGDSISFAENSNKLTLNNFNGREIIIEKASGPVEIIIEGDNLIDSSVDSTAEFALFSNAQLSITGNGNLTIKTNSNSASNTIIAPSLYVDMTNPLEIKTGIGCNNDANTYNNGIKLSGSLYNVSQINIELFKGEDTCSEGYSRNLGYGLYGESSSSNIINNNIGLYLNNNGSLKIQTVAGGIYWKGLNGENYDFLLENGSLIDIDYEVINSKRDNILLNLDSVNTSSHGEIIISPKISTEMVIDSELDNPIIIKNSKVSVTDLAIQANTSNSLISYSSVEGNNLFLGMTDATDENEYELEFNNINTEGNLFSLTNAYVETNGLTSSSSKLGLSENSLLDSDDFVGINKLKLINGISYFSNSEYNTSVSSNYLIHPNYELEISEIEEQYLAGLKKTNEELILSRIVQLNKPSNLDADEFNLPEDNEIKVVVEMPENDRETSDIIGRAYLYNNGMFEEEKISFDTGTKSAFGIIEIQNRFTLTNEQVSSGVYLTVADNNKITSLYDEETDVTIITPSAVDKTFLITVNKDFDDIWDKVQESISPSILKDIYQFGIETTDPDLEIPDGNYKVRLPLPEMGENDTLIIYEIKDGVKTERKISYVIDGDYVEFEITKEDLINNTIFALGVFEGSKKFTDGDYTLTTDTAIYRGCTFKANEEDIYASDGKAVKPVTFSLDCGDDYTLPDITYTISMKKPETSDGNVSLYSNENSIELTQIDENLSFNLNKENFGNKYTLVYKKLCDEVIQDSFVIKFNSNEGSSVSSMTVNINNNNIELPVPTKEDYEFLGWYYSNGEKVSSTKASEIKYSEVIITDEYACPTTSYEGVTFYASWKEKIVCEEVEKSFNLIYETNGGNEISKEIITQKSTDNLSEPVKSGYTFEGWYYDEALTNKISENIKKNELTVSQIKNDNGCITGYNDLKIYAKWTETEVICADPTNNTFEVIFDTNGGEAIANKTITVQENVEKIDVPSAKRSGYTFKGWYYENKNQLNVDDLNKIDKSIISDSYGCVTGYNNIILTAMWEKIQTCPSVNTIIKIVYETNGGSKLEDNIYGKVTKFSELQSPKRSGYIFEGWYYDKALTKKTSEDNWATEISNVPLTGGTMDDNGCKLDSVGTINLYAKWTKSGSHSITSEDGEIIYNELLNNNNDYEFVVDKLSKNDSYVDGFIENANKSVAPKVIIYIYKFNIESETDEELPGGKYQIKIPITEKIEKYDGLEIVELDSLGNKTDREIKLTKDGNYLIFEINKEDLGKTHFALIGNLIEQVSTGTIFKTGAFVILLGGLGYILFKAKKKNKLFRI